MTMRLIYEILYENKVKENTINNETANDKEAEEQIISTN